MRDRALNRYTTPHAAENLASYVGILNTIREDIEAGFLLGVEELIRADVFADFLGMAAELHDKGYDSAAAVIAGTVLEEHVRKLAIKHGVPIEDDNGRPRKVESLNADLVKASAYNKLVQKQVSAWYAIRSEAAHGNHDAYNSDQVRQLLDGVRDFLVAQPA
jgi:hypothetical protein